MRLIDADAAIDAVLELNVENRVSWVDAVIDMLDEMPTIQPKKGKWEGFNADKDGWKRTDGSPIFMSCSLCDGTVLNNGSAHWNFCPNCGADMRGEVKND